MEGNFLTATNERIINIISNNNTESKETSNLLKEKLKKRGFVIPTEYDERAELNICVGGDGAFLRAVHRYHFTNIPLLESIQAI